MNAQEEYKRWLNSNVIDDLFKKQLKEMSPEEIDDAFFKNVEFGTGGMRGIIGPGTNRLNIFTIRKAAIGFAIYVLEKYENAKEMGVVISHDNRHMSREFTLLCAKVFSEFGIKAYIFDSLRPTPELSYAVRLMKACGGIMITASHNPKEHNGFKVYDDKGCQLVPETIARLLEIIASLPNELDVTYTPVENKGEIITLDSSVDDSYVAEVEKIVINRDLPKKGYKIVFTPNHGTSYVNAMRIFNDLGYEVYPLLKQCTPDPDFSETLSPNPEEAKSFIEPIKYAQEIHADLIVMTDPDGDRCGLGYLSSKGTYETLTGNQSAAMLMDYIFSQKKAKGTLSKNGVMYNTIVTSSLGEEIASSYGLKTEQFLTGFKFIGGQINHYEEIGNGPTFEFGYEESYGCLIAPFARDKDALQAITMYSEMALYYHLQGKTLDQVWDDLGKRFGYHEDKAFSIYFEGSAGNQKMKDLMDKLHSNPYGIIEGMKVVKVEDYLKQVTYENGNVTPITLPKSDVVKIYFSDKTTIAVRPSGTEPKLKFYFGVVDDNAEAAIKKPAELYSKLRQTLGL